MRNEDHNIAENEPVSHLLGSLKRVEAPNDFDFRVKARIASRHSTTKASWVPAFVRVAVPAGVLVAGGYFGFNAFYPSQQGQQAAASMAGMNPAPVQMAPQPVDVEPQPIGAPDREDRIAMRPADTDPKINAPSTDKSVPRVLQPKREPAGGTLDSTFNIPHIISAKTPNANEPVSKPTAAIVGLSQLGISTISSGSTVTVGAVVPGSVAERSGVKTGDVIEGRDAKSIRVRRGGKSMSIELKP